MSFLDSLQHLSSLSKLLSKQKTKERVETILEPFQGMIQLALLGHCPTNSKLSIEKNILYIQLPHIHQGVVRWFNNDNKQDLVYIFNIIKRFKLFYADIFATQPELYNILVKNASKGLIRLQKTYESTQNITLVQTLKMYNSILLGKIDFNSLDVANGSDEPSTILFTMDQPKTRASSSEDDTDSFHSADSDKYLLENNTVISDSPSVHSMHSAKTSESTQKYSKPNIETIFSEITSLYPKELFVVVYNVFLMIQNKDIIYSNAIHIISNLFAKYNIAIHEWILQHLVF